ncbi:unnamed protein product [Caenorhabditis angaria]|uniref:LysM domain-containing protein n=1 Tax=Caenorhabditis angaria TaxID=860376 RepID=A0A9P1MVN1_9PELO|nr:unnamed protein product [Caenorhabditis angaria]
MMMIPVSSDYYQPDESTFLCGFKRVRQYGTTQSSSQSSPATPNSYTIYQVKQDDTLERISLQFNCSVSSLVRANKLWSPSALFMKEFIRIPIFNNDPVLVSHNYSSPSSSKMVSQPSESKRVIEDDRSMKDILKRIDKNIKSFQNYEISSDSVVFDSKCN